jgi:hypothetical protein
MENVVRRIHPEAPQQDVGSVVSTAERALQVAVAGVTHEARRAASCLLEPEVGDLVLVTLVPGRGCYVLAVLERQDTGHARLVHEGDLELQLPTGRLSMTAAQGMSVVSGKEVSCVTSSVRLHAAEADLFLERTSFLGRLARVEVESLKMLGRFFDSVIERLSQRVQRSYRKIEGMEQVRAEQLDYVAEKNVSVRGHNTLVTAEQLVKLDGEQVHLG